MPVFLVACSVVAFTIWSYFARPVNPLVRIVGILLKSLAVVLLATCLLQPMRAGTRPEPMSNAVAILVDRSESMNVSPTPGGETRLAQTQKQFQTNVAWLDNLKEWFDVRAFAFDARLDNWDLNESLVGNGHSSLLATSLKSLRGRLAGKPVAAAILFTDGNATDETKIPTDWSELGFPVYPVVSSQESAIADLRIAEISGNQTDFETAPVTITASIASTGMPSRDAKVQLLQLGTGKLIEEKRIQTSTDDEPNRIHFEFRPETSGIGFYRVKVIDEADAVDEATSQVEVTRINNERLIAVERNHGPYRILYVAGRPNWEYKFIRRALDADEEMQLVGLLRIANKEPKFSFRDSRVTSTNPLFAGTEDELDAAEQYDEPVILRLGIRESEELSKGFPKSPEELFAYHGVILDDVDVDFFSQDQMLLLRRFVAERGGGLLFLGGQESFRDPTFSTSPLGDLSPVYPIASETIPPDQATQFRLTRDGLLMPWTRLRSTESEEAKRLGTIAPLRTVNPVRGVKPGASVLAKVSTSDDEAWPALVAQRFGAGRTMAIPIGDLWRWSMRRHDEDRADPEQLWRQWTRWMVGEVPKRTEISITPAPSESEPTIITVVVRDEVYKPLDNADVRLEIKPLSKDESVTIKATPDTQRAGYYVAEYYTKEADGFHVLAKASSPDGSPIPEDTSGWVHEPEAAEFENLATHRALLETLAKQTGGRVMEESELSDFTRELPTEKVPVTQTWVYPIWHQPWVMLLALVCLCAEWGLRRWKGLA